jgi:Catalytic LigB subunit of aromatic ring-opening dioxygenase
LFVQEHPPGGDVEQRLLVDEPCPATTRHSINTPVDTAFLDRLVGDRQALRRIMDLEYLREYGPEGNEMVMWLIMRGALGADVEEVHRHHHHVPASNTAVGHIVLGTQS